VGTPVSIPVLPDEIAEALDDASPADDAATDEAVTAFIAEHVRASRPETLAGLTSALRKRFDAGESRHQSTVTVLPTAMKEARAGYYPAQAAINAITPMFLEAAAKPPMSGKQGAARNGAVARSEFHGMLAWAVGQALGADLDEVHARLDQNMPEIPWPTEPPDDDHYVGEYSPNGDRPADAAETRRDTEPTTWEPLDLGPYLRGEVQPPKQTVGLARSDGIRFLYDGRENVVIGETESGKTWFALGCVARELRMGHHVLYIHYEEADAASTIERLRLLGVPDTDTATGLRFIAPNRPPHAEWLCGLLNPVPTLVIHDGINEAMTLLGAEIKDVAGASEFRRRLIRPCTKAGATTLGCDHMPMVRDHSRRDAYGSVHKGNALDGARILLENIEPFGRNMRGASSVYVTKDRPGRLRAHGTPTKTPGKTFMGVLVVDDMTGGPDFLLELYAPRDDEDDATGRPATLAELGDIVHQVIAALPDHSVDSLRKLYAAMRQAEQPFREQSIRMAVDDLVIAGRLAEVPGKRGATGYRAVLTAAQESRT
jgi:hypothetical protein